MSYPWHENDLLALLAQKGRLPHALLFRGPQGIGKLAFAEALAQALLCASPAPDGKACGRCTACSWAGQDSHPDLRRLEPAILARPSAAEQDGEKSEADRKEKASSEIVIKQVRAMEDFINMTSHQGGMKVVLIHPAEALNVSASNALLKNLEEPPPGTCFLLVSHRWHHLLPTVTSRCRHVPLPPPAPEAARAWLARQGTPDPDLALAHAGGAPLQAAGFDDEYWERRAGFLKSLTARDFNARALAEGLADAPPALVLGWMQKWAYDLLCHALGGAVRYNPDFSDVAQALAGRLDAVQAGRFLRRLVRLQRFVAHPLNTRLFFEDLLLAYASYARGDTVELAA